MKNSNQLSDDSIPIYSRYILKLVILYFEQLHEISGRKQKIDTIDFMNQVELTTPKVNESLVPIKIDNIDYLRNHVEGCFTIHLKNNSM